MFKCSHFFRATTCSMLLRVKLEQGVERLTAGVARQERVMTAPPARTWFNCSTGRYRQDRHDGSENR